MSVLVVAEHDNHSLKPSTLHTLTAAQQLHDTVDLLVAGFHCDKVVAAAQSIGNVAQVLVADAETYQHALAEAYTPLILSLEKNYSHLLAPATTFGKNLMPRVAAKLDVAQISDVIEIVAPKTYRRLIYAGNAIATMVSNDAKQVLTIRPTAFAAASENSNSAKKIEIDFKVDNQLSTFVKAELHESERPELTAADIVIAGGRGLKDESLFTRLIAIADRLGAAIGASRAAVDAGLAPNDFQVGQTGKVVAPKLYIAVGISGAIQHLAGMKDSRVIVAINKDPDAPIFQIADYGLVADINVILKEWEDALTALGY